MRRLTPLHKAYWLGYRRGLNRALAKMRDKATQWETEIDELQDQYRELLNELREVRDERPVQLAASERAMLTWLH